MHNTICVFVITRDSIKIIMKKLFVPQLLHIPETATEIPETFNQENVKWHSIDIVNWADHPYHPKTHFRIAHSGDTIYIHYHVTEDDIRAMVFQDNGPVWEDSCCEFFSQLEKGGTYYNMECNCIGTLLIGAGENRKNRKRASSEILKNIDRWSSNGRHPLTEQSGPSTWDMSLKIPVSAYFMHHLQSVAGTVIYANFYKCGDRLRKSHYLSWNPINTPEPDFHQPRFFGELDFE